MAGQLKHDTTWREEERAMAHNMWDNSQDAEKGATHVLLSRL